MINFYEYIKLDDEEKFNNMCHDLLEIKKLNNTIKYTYILIDRTIEIIKQQPSEDDTWILERLNAIKQCLNGGKKK